MGNLNIHHKLIKSLLLICITMLYALFVFTLYGPFEISVQAILNMASGLCFLLLLTTSFFWIFIDNHRLQITFLALLLLTSVTFIFTFKETNPTVEHVQSTSAQTEFAKEHQQVKKSTWANYPQIITFRDFMIKTTTLILAFVIVILGLGYVLLQKKWRNQRNS